MNIPDQPIAASHQIHSYTELEQQIHETCGPNIPNGSSQLASAPV